jgi:hypothetical protein
VVENLTHTDRNCPPPRRHQRRLWFPFGGLSGPFPQRRLPYPERAFF